MKAIAYLFVIAFAVFLVAAFLFVAEVINV